MKRRRRILTPSVWLDNEPRGRLLSVFEIFHLSSWNKPLASTPALCPGQLPNVEMRQNPICPNAGVLRIRTEVVLFSAKGSGDIIAAVSNAVGLVQSHE